MKLQQKKKSSDSSHLHLSLPINSLNSSYFSGSNTVVKHLRQLKGCFWSQSSHVQSFIILENRQLLQVHTDTHTEKTSMHMCHLSPITLFVFIYTHCYSHTHRRNRHINIILGAPLPITFDISIVCLTHIFHDITCAHMCAHTNKL